MNYLCTGSPLIHDWTDSPDGFSPWESNFALRDCPDHTSPRESEGEDHRRACSVAGCSGLGPGMCVFHAHHANLDRGERDSTRGRG